MHHGSNRANPIFSIQEVTRTTFQFPAEISHGDEVIHLLSGSAKQRSARRSEGISTGLQLTRDSAIKRDFPTETLDCFIS
jgi:hypothetical protein